jgi:hypothetical protein
MQRALTALKLSIYFAICLHLPAPLIRPIAIMTLPELPADKTVSFDAIIDGRGIRFSYDLPGLNHRCIAIQHCSGAFNRRDSEVKAEISELTRENLANLPEAEYKVAQCILSVESGGRNYRGPSESVFSESVVSNWFMNTSGPVNSSEKQFETTRTGSSNLLEVDSNSKSDGTLEDPDLSSSYQTFRRIQATHSPSWKSVDFDTESTTGLDVSSTMFIRSQQKSQQLQVSTIFVHAGAGYHSKQNEPFHLKACSE